MNTRISIESPCTADWATMSGDERKRFCGQCNKHVHDLSAMAPDRAETLVREAKGRLCVRFQPDAQGRVVHRSRSRWARWGLVALAGLAAAPALAAGRVESTDGVGAWIAEVVSSLAERAVKATTPEPMIMGEMAIEAEPRAFQNRTDEVLVVDCGLEKAVIAPGASETLDAWPYDACSVQGEHHTVQIELDEVACERTGDGLTCSAPSAR